MAQVVGIPPGIYAAALRAFFDLKPLHLMILAFGVSIVIVISLLYLWKHLKGG